MRVLVALLLMPLAGCAAPPPEPDLESATAASRLLALGEEDWTNSDRDLALLIEQLESSDPSVRMVAIDRLREVTGEDLGFRYDDPPAERARAVDGWVDWLKGRTDPADIAEPG